MTGFVPTGCNSCLDTLRQVYADEFPEYPFPNKQEWNEAVRVIKGTSRRTENSALLKRMIHSINRLRKELYDGDRVALYFNRHGEQIIERHRFEQDASVSMFISGELPWSTGRTMLDGGPSVYIRDGKSPAEVIENLDASGNEQSRRGRPGTGRDAALVYWGMFPDGHDPKAESWKGVLRSVNRQLERLGLKSVGMTAFKENVNDLRPQK